jgi:hypothetical protein
MDSSRPSLFAGTISSRPMRSFPGQENRPLARNGRDARGDRERHPLGQRAQPPAMENVDGARGPVGAA